MLLSKQTPPSLTNLGIKHSEEWDCTGEQSANSFSRVTVSAVSQSMALKRS